MYRPNGALNRVLFDAAGSTQVPCDAFVRLPHYDPFVAFPDPVPTPILEPVQPLVDAPQMVGQRLRNLRLRDMSQRRRLTIVLALNLTMIVALVVVGLSAHSLGVLAAGGDYVADSTAIGLGLLAVATRDRVGEQSKAPTVVAGINGAALLVVSAFVLVAGVRRLVEGTPDIQGLPVLVVSAVATGVMVAGVFVLGTGAGREDLHMRSVLLDTVSDAVASAAVAVSGLVIYLTGRSFWLDSALSVLIAVVVGFGAVRLLRDVNHALRTGTQLDIDND